MRTLASILAVLAMCAAGANAALTMVEDFEALNLGSIDMQHEIVEYGFSVELWNAQRNGSQRGDHGWSNVVVEDGDQCLELINRDTGGELDTVYTCLYLGEANSIYSQGTIYLRYKADSANDCVFATNDLINGYVSDIAGDNIADDSSYQGTNNYSAMGSMCELGGGDELFRGRDGANGYLTTNPALQSNTWYELWSQIDCANFQTRFYICEDGGTPTVIPNPLGGEWWGWRNQSRTNYSVMNLKFFMGNQPIENRVYVDTIAVDNGAYTTDRLADADPVTPCLGDANGDKTVDIQDFVILKQNYGIATGATFAMGDFNGDGAVDIQDFVILKQNYGTTCE